jgi:hypothetical protein
MGYMDEDDLKALRFAEETAGMIDRVCAAWDEAAEYALSQDSSITRDDLLTPGCTELYELIDDTVPEASQGQRAMVAREAFARIVNVR